MSTLAPQSLEFDRRRELAVVLVAGAGSVMLGGAAAFATPLVPLAFGLLVAVAVFILIAARPIIGAYVYLAALPFVAGMERGAILPEVRLHEALQVFVTAAILAGLYVHFLRFRTARVHITRFDVAILVLATLASVWPLAWLFARGRAPTTDDVFSTLILWRLAALYALFRYAVRTPAQVRRCLWILIVGAVALAVISTLQALGLPTITFLLGSDAPQGRGQGTLSSSIAVGDYLAYTLAVVIAMYLRQKGHHRALLAVGAALLIGALGTGQFSAWIAAAVVLFAVSAHERRLSRLLIRAIPIVLVGLVLTWPVVGARLAGFGGDLGLPPSWLGRIDNLEHFYLPELGGFNWVLGVRPDSVIAAPETWRELIYLESGVLWLFWVGGIPLFVAFIWFLRQALRKTREVARARVDDIGVIALGAWASLCAMAVLTIIDMHLTLRGGGDLLFILLGLSANRLVPRVRPSPVTGMVPASDGQRPNGQQKEHASP
jgi:hypothetical protein